MEFGKLKLRRKVGERIVIGNDIVVSIEGVRGNRCSLLVTAPKGVPVFRGEVIEKIAASGELNAVSGGDHGRG